MPEIMNNRNISLRSSWQPLEMRMLKKGIMCTINLLVHNILHVESTDSISTMGLTPNAVVVYLWHIQCNGLTGELLLSTADV